MTNKTLQEILKEYPEDMPVSITDYFMEEIKDIECIDVDTAYDSEGNPIGRHVIIYILD